jgi:hypothetical protein
MVQRQIDLECEHYRPQGLGQTDNSNFCGTCNVDVVPVVNYCKNCAGLVFHWSSIMFSIVVDQEEYVE